MSFSCKQVISMVITVCFRFAVLNSWKHFVQVSRLWCGACGLPITQCTFVEWCDSISSPASVWMTSSCALKPAHQTVCQLETADIRSHFSLCCLRCLCWNTGRGNRLAAVTQRQLAAAHPWAAPPLDLALTTARRSIIPNPIIRCSPRSPHTTPHLPQHTPPPSHR